MGRLTKRLLNKLLACILTMAMVMASIGVPVNASDVTEETAKETTQPSTENTENSGDTASETPGNGDEDSNGNNNENNENINDNTNENTSGGEEIELTPEDEIPEKPADSDENGKEKTVIEEEPDEDDFYEEEIEEEEELPEEETENIEDGELTDEDADYADDVPDDPLGSRYHKKRVAQSDMIPLSAADEYEHGAYAEGVNLSKGIDVSKYQKDIDWEKVKEDGVQFAFIRVGFRGYGSTGSLNDDIKYKDNIEGALAVGIPVGVYMFSQATSEYEAVEEAEYILERIEDYNVTLPIIMDFEYAGDPGRLERAHLSRQEATDVCNAFCERVASEGYEAMVYADYGMLTNHLYPEEIEENYKIWIARWNEATCYDGEYSSWQFSDIGRIEGISDSVGYIATDLNFGYGLLDIPVTLHAKGGMFEDTDELALTLEQGTTLLEAGVKLPRKEDRTFRGWSEDKDSKKATYNFSEPIITTKLELYAVWRKKKPKKAAVLSDDDMALPDNAVDKAGKGGNAGVGDINPDKDDNDTMRLTDYVLPEKMSLRGHLFVRFTDADSISSENIAQYSYIRGGVKPEIELYYEPFGTDLSATEPSENAILLVPDEDYRIRYVNFRRPAEHDKTNIFGASAAPTINVIGRKDYKGSENIRYSIY